MRVKRARRVGLVLAASTLLAAVGCGEDQSGDAQPVAVEPPPATETEPIRGQVFEPKATYIAEAEAEDGATERIELEIGDVITTEAVPDGFPDPALACTVDPDRDAVIPARATVTNTTEGFAVDTTTAIAVKWPELEISIEGAAEYSDGPSCREPAIGDNAMLRVSWRAVPSGGSNTMRFFFVIHDYYGPRHPEGKTWAVGASTVYFTDVRSDSSGMWERTCISGPGINDGSFTFDGSDARVAASERLDVPLRDIANSKPEPECTKET